MTHALRVYLAVLFSIRRLPLLAIQLRQLAVLPVVTMVQALTAQAP
jgi:hypothetical protein